MEGVNTLAPCVSIGAPVDARTVPVPYRLGICGKKNDFLFANVPVYT